MHQNVNPTTVTDVYVLLSVTILHQQIAAKPYSTPECQVSRINISQSPPVSLHNQPVFRGPADARALFSGPIVLHRDKRKENRTAVYGPEYNTQAKG